MSSICCFKDEEIKEARDTATWSNPTAELAGAQVSPLTFPLLEKVLEKKQEEKGSEVGGKMEIAPYFFRCFFCFIF